jgi:hypothetical protein
MGDKIFYSFIAIIIIIMLFLSYWLIPFNTTEFSPSSNSNFTMNNSENNTLQFYPNMRFSETSLSYKIMNCSLKRMNDMTWAMNIISEVTVLDFYPVEFGQQITITCKDTISSEGGLFIAGEGGPTNITVAGEFNVIEQGKILLLRDSDCERPNIALHELLHVFGFAHSTNPKNIMYEISKCDQTMGQDLIDFINNIYSIPPEPDLLFDYASVLMRGKYLDVNFSIRNYGLKYSKEAIVKILADGKEVKEINIPPIEIGEGIYEYRNNMLVKQLNVRNIELKIDYNSSELSKANNDILFEIKK